MNTKQQSTEKKASAQCDGDNAAKQAAAKVEKAAAKVKKATDYYNWAINPGTVYAAQAVFMAAHNAAKKCRAAAKLACEKTAAEIFENKAREYDGIAKEYSEKADAAKVEKDMEHYTYTAEEIVLLAEQIVVKSGTAVKMDNAIIAAAAYLSNRNHTGAMPAMYCLTEPDEKADE